jgi:hypothetical protein
MKLKPWLRGSLLLTFVLAVGVLVGYSLARRPSRSPAANPMEPQAFVRRLDKELGLDSAQRVAIVAILTRRQRSIDSAWRQLRPSVRATIDSAQAEIVDVLRPDQRQHYLSLVRAAHGGAGMMRQP